MSKVPLEEKRPNSQSPLQRILENVRVGGNLTVGDIIQQVFIGGESQAQRQESRNRQALLKQVKNEVDSRLEQSLHNAVLINLGKEKQPQQVKCPWDMEVKVGNQPSEPLPPEEGIIDFFNREAIAGKFLILGTPGAGKTTTLLLGAYFGLIIGVIIGLFFGVFFGIWAWLALGQSKEIKPVETLNSSWSNLGKSLIVGMILGFITWVITKLLILKSSAQSPALILSATDTVNIVLSGILIKVLITRRPQLGRTTES
ncbi:MAG: hypothetical protein AB1589_13970 [Cyanobacteriota bacterium]